MDFYLFEVTLKSQLDYVTYPECGVLYAESYEEAAEKLKKFYKDDDIEEIHLKFYSSEGVCILSPVQVDEVETLFDEVEGGRTYTINLENIS